MLLLICCCFEQDSDTASSIFTIPNAAHPLHKSAMMAGVMHKKASGMSLRTWTKRFFVYIKEQRAMHYFESSAEAQPWFESTEADPSKCRGAKLKGTFVVTAVEEMAELLEKLEERVLSQLLAPGAHAKGSKGSKGKKGPKGARDTSDMILMGLHGRMVQKKRNGVFSAYRSAREGAVLLCTLHPRTKTRRRQKRKFTWTLNSGTEKALAGANARSPYTTRRRPRHE